MLCTVSMVVVGDGYGLTMFFKLASDLTVEMKQSLKSTSTVSIHSCGPCRLVHLVSINCTTGK